MNLANALVGIVLLLNIGATIAYAASGKFNTAIYWLGASVIAAALLWREVAR